MKAVKVSAVQEQGLEGFIVDIECQLTNSLPAIVIVGLAGKSLDESKERIRSAFTSASIPLPKKRITLNLAPADLPKEGTGFDVAIAASILLSQGAIQAPPKNSVLIGELGLDGTIRPVRGIVGKLLSAKKLGIKTVFLPAANIAQADLIPGLNLVPLSSLTDLYQKLSTGEYAPLPTSGSINTTPPASSVTIDDIIGQARAKRALQIAAAGHHNILLNGPPGVGKSMLAKAFVSLMPPLSHEESLVVTHLHSLANDSYEEVITQRPLRSPHHSASATSIVGGGSSAKPGEISLSHFGVLFLDEFPEFTRQILESLRQPLEDRIIRVARAKQSVTYPAHFILIATRNPCPCGYYGSSRECVCLPHAVAAYEKKISGPIADRIDIHVQVDEIDTSRLLDQSAQTKDQPSLQAAIKKAYARQQERFNSTSTYNSDLTNKQIKALHIDPQAKELLDTAAARLGLSARAYMRVVKVARTIADLDDSDAITTKHVSEAVQYRPVNTSI